jgi:hypothetical protein
MKTKLILKTILGLIIGLTLGCITSHAQSPTLPPLVDRKAGSIYLAWDANGGLNVTNYVLYWGTSSSVETIVFAQEDGTTITNTLNTGVNYTDSMNTGTNTAATVMGLDVGVEYFFAAKAVRDDGVMSDYDEEIAQVILSIPAPPINKRIVKVPVYIIDVFFSDVPGEWSTNRQIKLVVDTKKPYQFFSVRNRMETVDAILID